MLLRWPSSLPRAFLIDGFSYVSPDNTIGFDADAGPGKRRRRSTAAAGRMSGEMMMTLAQIEQLTDFVASVAGGALPFLFPRQMGGAGDILVRLAAPWSCRATRTGYMRVSISLEVLP